MEKDIIVNEYAITPIIPAVFLIMSFGYSFTYWYLDKILKREFQLATLMKFNSILTLLCVVNPREPWLYGVLIAYIVGDIVIRYNQKYSIIFFGLGHLQVVAHFIAQTSWSAIAGLALITPLAYRSGLFFYYMLEIQDRNYYYAGYIVSLHAVVLTTLANGYLGHIFFALSDISIGLGLEKTAKFEWILYYISIVYYVFIM